MPQDRLTDFIGILFVIAAMWMTAVFAFALIHWAMTHI